MVNIEILSEIAEEIVDKLDISEGLRSKYVDGLAERMKKASDNERMLSL